MSWLVGAVKSLGEGQARQFVSCPQPFQVALDGLLRCIGFVV
jgi:hypothetical protein